MGVLDFWILVGGTAQRYTFWNLPEPSAMNLGIEFEPEQDGQWLAGVPQAVARRR